MKLKKESVTLNINQQKLYNLQLKEKEEVGNKDTGRERGKKRERAWRQWINKCDIICKVTQEEEQNDTEEMFEELMPENF